MDSFFFFIDFRGVHPEWKLWHVVVVHLMGSLTSELAVFYRHSYAYNPYVNCYVCCVSCNPANDLQGGVIWFPRRAECTFLEALVHLLCNCPPSSVLYCKGTKCNRSPWHRYLVLVNNIADIMLFKASMHLDIFGHTRTSHSVEGMSVYSKSPTPHAQEPRSVHLHKRVPDIRVLGNKAYVVPFVIPAMLQCLSR